MSVNDSLSVKVVSGFVASEDIPSISDSQLRWSYSEYRGLLNDTYPSWNAHLCGNSGVGDRATHDDVLSSTPGLEKINRIWALIKADLAPGYGLVRAYASGHPYGSDGTVHAYSKPSDEEMVAVINVNTEWKDSWAGEMVFFDPARECLSIRHRPGRLLLFDGSISRVSRAPSRDCPRCARHCHSTCVA